jgi:F0F1-type ATP synthase membrane subunit b/b'
MWHPDQVTEDDLKAAVEAHNKAIEDARTQRDQAIAQARRDGMRPTAIVNATGYTREHVRRILRAQGIESDR